MKHERSAVRMFGNPTHNQLIEGFKLTGFTAESLALFLGEHLTVLDSSFFVQVESEDISFSLYSSCIEHREDLFMFFPEIKGRGFVEGFSSDKTRFRRETIIKLSSGNLFCCVGSKKSLREKSIKKNLKEGLETVFFSVGDSVDVGAISEKLYGFEYKKVQTADEPGSYSLRGDVLDIFP